MTAILGVSAFYHDSAAALQRDGEIVAAAQEERFTRKKGDPGLPQRALEYCLREAGLTARDVDYLVFYEKPLVKFERLLETYLALAPSGYQSFRMAMPLWLREKLFQKDLLRKEMKRHADGFDWDNRLLFADRVERAIARAKQGKNGQFAVFGLELEQLKAVNDGLGRAAGRELLVGSAERIRQVLSPRDTLARLDAGEFAILVEEIRGPGAAARAARAIQESMRPAFPVAGQEVFTSTAIGIAHAGWRGLAAGVLENTVAAMRCAPARIAAWLGPAIGPKAFEVGPDVHEAFVKEDPDAAAAFVATSPRKWHADLAALARRRLARSGVRAVTGGELCTHSDPSRFFSFRRDGTSGRMAAFIWRTERSA